MITVSYAYNGSYRLQILLTNIPIEYNTYNLKAEYSCMSILDEILPWGWDLAECEWDLAEYGWDLAELWMRSSRDVDEI